MTTDNGGRAGRIKTNANNSIEQTPGESDDGDDAVPDAVADVLLSDPVGVLAAVANVSREDVHDLGAEDATELLVELAEGLDESGLDDIIASPKFKPDDNPDSDGSGVLDNSDGRAFADGGTTKENYIPTSEDSDLDAITSGTLSGYQTRTRDDADRDLDSGNHPSIDCSGDPVPTDELKKRARDRKRDRLDDVRRRTDK